jgi:dTDP-glucose pyrophosphorylase
VTTTRTAPRGRGRGDRDSGGRQPLVGVLTLAGAGSRMLPWSRGLRKEFLPLFDAGRGGESVLKPVAHLVVETLMGANVTDITLVVQPRDRGTVANYFTDDPELHRRAAPHPERLAETREFHRRLRALRLRYAEQPRPAGFGDAVLRAERSVEGRPFILHASDAFLDEPRRGELPAAMGRMLLEDGLDAVLLVRSVRDPRRYGVVEGVPAGRYGRWRRLTVTGMEEKPERPRSHWAATAVYAFRPSLFDALRTARRRHSSTTELEVTWGIQEIADRGGKIAALVLSPPAFWRSVGSPESYYRALRATHRERS